MGPHMELQGQEPHQKNHSAMHCTWQLIFMRIVKGIRNCRKIHCSGMRLTGQAENRTDIIKELRITKFILSLFMYEYIKGNLTELTPAGAVIETGGIGYFIHISVTTYSRINGHESVKLYLHQAVREDAHLLYGFADKNERELFRMLISVNGIGANTALMMLSSFLPDDLSEAILTENVNVLKSIKGIGAK